MRAGGRLLLHQSPRLDNAAAGFVPFFETSEPMDRQFDEEDVDGSQRMRSLEVLPAVCDEIGRV